MRDHELETILLTNQAPHTQLRIHPYSENLNKSVLQLAKSISTKKGLTKCEKEAFNTNRIGVKYSLAVL